MKYQLTRITLAAMLLALPAAAVWAQAAGPQMNVVFSIPTIANAQDSEKITAGLKQVKGVTNVAGLTPQSKMAVITYSPAQVSVHQIAQAVAAMPGASGTPNQVSLLIRVVNLSDAATRDKALAALKKVPGVASAAAIDANAGILAIQFAPLTAGDAAGGPKGATQEQITKALADAGVEATAELTPAAAAAPPEK
jgi:copper chaperone CopZ